MNQVRVRALTSFTGHMEGYKKAGDEWMTDETRALELVQAGNVERVTSHQPGVGTVEEGEGEAGRAAFRRGAETVAGGDGGHTGRGAKRTGGGADARRGKR